MSKIAFIFPDRAHRKPEWEKIFMKHADKRKVFDLASECLDLDMKALCFEENEQS